MNFRKRLIIIGTGMAAAGIARACVIAPKEQKKCAADCGAITQADPSEAGFEDYGFKKKFHIDKKADRRVLIAGAGSYIGNSFASHCRKYYPNIQCKVVDMEDENWKKRDFSGYEAVFHVAGIAHADVGKISEAERGKYYRVNTDLAIECCKKAKEDGVKQFIFMSSMIIYGGTEKVDEATVPKPANFYGNSKWLADRGVRKEASESFKVAVLRSPVIYGGRSRGNYCTLSKVASKSPVFPDINNRRSMLYIENLCEFVSLLMLSGEGGVYFPQNSSYSKTGTMVELIGEQVHKPVYLTGLLNPAVRLFMHVPGKIGELAEKAFGNSYYEQKISSYEGLDYQKIGLKESIRRTERVNVRRREKKVVLILVNHEIVIYNFRLELVEYLLSEGYEVHISTPPGERIDELRSLGAICHDIEIDRHGMNPLKDWKILREYRKLMKVVNPFIVLGYTIKPNIYGAIASRQVHIPFVANITGLGTAVENIGIKQKLIVFLYKIAFGGRYGKVQRVFFQNRDNEAFFRKAGIALDRHALLPGSGVNLDRYSYCDYPECDDGTKGSTVRFAFISRIMKEKGIDQYLDAAEKIRKKYSNAEFHVCGFCEPEYDGRLQEEYKKGTVIYHGMIRDVRAFIGNMHCIIHPTYYPEGISNVLLEACSCGRPIITTDRAGCREVVQNAVNGYMIREKDSENLVEAVEKFLSLSCEEKRAMGIAGRKLVEENFDRKIVIEKYVAEINVSLGR